MPNTPKIVFFGTPHFAVTILDKLAAAETLPELIVTTPDMPAGRHLQITASPVKEWAIKKNIEIFQPESLKSEEVYQRLSKISWDLFIVAAYGKIIPQNIIDIPVRKTLNVHPSLLPHLRGSSPVESAILENMADTGVTIMRLDAEMDHGPIVLQEKITISPWPISGPELERILAEKGGVLLANIIPDWIIGKIKEKEQDHTQATYTKKIKKEDGLLDLQNDPYANYLKIKAYAGWPKAYFFIEHGGKKIRLIVTEATYENGALTITRVIPEGKREMEYQAFLKGLK